ncbi:MAG: hypothetical protein HGA29_06305 [Syntrophaceae bacterium]|nr:hypothetical protein [Syntrophaceae bacterium]
MSRKKGESFAGKHAGKDVKIDEQIAAAIQEKAVNGEISCHNVMDIAQKLNKGIAIVGVNVDLMELHINKCQLGLFGHTPKTRIVKAAASVAPELEEAIRKSLKDGRLPCITAWNIADTQKIPRMDVAAACEKLGIKIKPCQIGAF